MTSPGVLLAALVATTMLAPPATANTAAQQAATSAPYAGRGPYRVIMTTSADLPDHAIYRPADLAALSKASLPIVIWGNGGCEAVANRYRYFLSDLASHGYLVVALGTIGPRSVEHGWPAEPVLPPTAPDVNAPAPSYPEGMTKAIDWAIAQDRKAGSPLHGKIDTAKIAVAGHSCGGLQALAIASTDARITTTLLLNSGVWSMGPGGLPGAPSVTKESLNRVHGSIVFLNGQNDVALPNAKDDFARLKDVPAFRAARRGVAHAGTYWLPNGGAFATVTAAWLDWQLKGSKRASRWFVGPQCRLCVDPRWNVEQKNLR